MTILIIKYIIASVLSYFIGSFSASIFLSKNLLGDDVRTEGSGNAGATNMARVFGMSFGIVTLLCDFIKALLAVWLSRRLIGDWGLLVGGAFCLIGHCFPVFYQFKGGKGISAGAAVALAIDWRVFLLVVLAFALGAVFSRKVSVGSVLAAIAIVPASFIAGAELPGLLLAFFGMVFVTWRHKDNILRVANGTEPDFKAAKNHKLSISKEHTNEK